LDEERSTIMRRLIDRHLEPIAIRYGLEQRCEEVKRTRHASCVPEGLHKLTRSQLCCIIDMFNQGWTIEDLGDFYDVSYDAIEETLGGKTEKELKHLRSQLRRAIGRERKRWQSHGES
jgi:response regulator of citrate/malate metabolism